MVSVPLEAPTIAIEGTPTRFNLILRRTPVYARLFTGFVHFALMCGSATAARIALLRDKLFTRPWGKQQYTACDPSWQYFQNFTRESNVALQYIPKDLIPQHLHVLFGTSVTIGQTVASPNYWGNACAARGKLQPVSLPLPWQGLCVSGALQIRSTHCER